MSNIATILHKIQQELNVPKDMLNSFGGYKYRNKEGILSSVKPMLPESCFVNVTDDIVMIGSRYYVKSTAALTMDGEFISSVGWAREQDTKKGMDEAQITGAASSYAGKYALCGLFAIDDSALDPDATNKHGKETVETEAQSRVSKEEHLDWIESQTDYALARSAASSMMKEAKRDGWEKELTDCMKALKIKLEGK